MVGFSRLSYHEFGALPSPLWGGVGGGGSESEALILLHAPPPSPTLPHKGGGSTPNVRQQQLVARLASLAEPRERVGREAAARVDRGGARPRGPDPGLGPRARRGRQARQLPPPAGHS